MGVSSHNKKAESGLTLQVLSEVLEVHVSSAEKKAISEGTVPGHPAQPLPTRQQVKEKQPIGGPNPQH